MPWFNGDIESVTPGQWVLAVSLNHQVDSDPSGASPLGGCGSSVSDVWWKSRRTMNTDRWYGRFFSPLARVAAAATGQQLAKEKESEFATRRMIFVEICPYVSNRFNLDWPVIKELLETDLGFRLASEINHLLIEKGEPALVLVNGNSAIVMFRHLYANELELQEVRYDSCHPPKSDGKQKRLRHYCGSLHLGEKTIPVVGFPFLQTPMTHNSDQEVALLGAHAFRCTRSHSSSRAPQASFAGSVP